MKWLNDSQKDYHGMNFVINYIWGNYFGCYNFSYETKHLYRLCNFNKLQMPDSYVKQNCCPIRILGNKSDILLETHSITITNSIRIYLGTTMGYPTQFSISEKLK